MNRWWRTRFWLPVLGVTIVLFAGWTGARTWYWEHLRQVTGRTDVPRVSCFYCHRLVESPRTRPSSNGPVYISNEGLAVSSNGKALFVAATGSGRLLEVDLLGKKVCRSVELPGRPHGVALSGDGLTVAVTCRDTDRVVLLDAASLKVLDTVPTGREPLGVALSHDGRRLFVANGMDDNVLMTAVRGSFSPRRLIAGHEPYALALSRDGALLAVANRLSLPAPMQTIPVSEVTFICARQGRVLERRDLVSAHLSEGVTISSDGSFVLATAVRTRNLLPLTQVARGAVMNSTLVFMETRKGGRTVQFPLADVNAYFADPCGVAITPDDRMAFVAHGGARVVTAVNLEVLKKRVSMDDRPSLEDLADDLGASSSYVLARIETRDNPRTLAMSPDGRRLYVAERLSDSIGVIDTKALRMVDHIDLGGPSEITLQRRGERLFRDASVTFQGQFSCRSCHPDGRTDGLVWDFEIDGIGQNLVETRSLGGIRDTAPFKWNGKNPNLATQCGPRFARVLTRSDPFPPADLDALVAYIESLAPPPVRVPRELEASRKRGREIFFRSRKSSGDEIPVAKRCSTCHRPPLFTDRLKTDVGTGGKFDTPHLFGIALSAPYLHDGRALTLEAIWTVHSPNDTHGVTSDLTKSQLNDLVNYLRSL